MQHEEISAHKNTDICIVTNAVLSGTVSEIGGGKFANGAITGAFAVMFNDLMHGSPKSQYIKFKHKERAYLYMVDYSLKTGKEIAAFYIDDGTIIVFNDFKNTETSSKHAPIYKDKKGKPYIIFEGKNHYITGEVHTHPIEGIVYNNNPLRISSNDILLANKYFDGVINILIPITRDLYSVSVNGNGLMFPQLKKWRKK